MRPSRHWSVLPSRTGSSSRPPPRIPGTTPRSSARAIAVAGGGNEISGVVYEDVDGDAEIGDGVLLPAVKLALYRDGGDSRPDGVDDVPFGSTVTDAAGAYRFSSLSSGRYWVVVASRTVTPSTVLVASFVLADVWAEQTYGSRGAWCDDGASGIAELPAPGACYGGRRSSISDDTATLARSEHVTSVELTADSIAGRGLRLQLCGGGEHARRRSDLGTSRVACVSSSGTVTPSPDRASSIFRIPTSDAGYNGSGNGEYTIRPRLELPKITDSLIVDGGQPARFRRGPDRGAQR